MKNILGDAVTLGWRFGWRSVTFQNVTRNFSIVFDKLWIFSIRKGHPSNFWWNIFWVKLSGRVTFWVTLRNVSKRHPDFSIVFDKWWIFSLRLDQKLWKILSKTMEKRYFIHNILDVHPEYITVLHLSKTMEKRVTLLSRFEPVWAGWAGWCDFWIFFTKNIFGKTLWVWVEPLEPVATGSNRLKPAHAIFIFHSFW